MAYIKTDQVKQMRSEIKSNFPAKDGWKFSVTREGFTAVKCSILEAPINLILNPERTNETVNHYYIKELYQGQASEVLNKINEILNKDNYDNSDSQTDYFDVGHYVNIRIGEWDKPFKVTNN